MLKLFGNKKPKTVGIGSKVSFCIGDEVFHGRIVATIADGYKVKIRGHLYPVPVSHDMITGVR